MELFYVSISDRFPMTDLMQLTMHKFCICTIIFKLYRGAARGSKPCPWCHIFQEFTF